MNLADGKNCTKCGEWKPPTEYSKDKRKSDGLQSWCKACRRQYCREWNIANREKRAEYKREYRAANKDRILDYGRTYRAANRDKRASYCREWRVAHPEKALEYYRKSCANGARERYREQRAAHPEKTRAITHRRLARKRKLAALWTERHAQEALDHFGGVCAVCGRPPGLWHTIAWDHWIPLSANNCPGTVPWNMVPLCHGDGGCNNSKNAKDAFEWLTKKFSNRKGKQIYKSITDYLETRKRELS